MGVESPQNQDEAGGGGVVPTGDGLVLLGAACPATNVVFHGLEHAFGGFPVVLEAPVSRWSLVKRRASKLGVTTVAGQVLFSAMVVPALARAARPRIAAIAEEHNLDLTPIERSVMHIPSVNSEMARTLLRRLAPKVVVVSGARIISKETLNCVDATFVNLHAGITPQYRGVHGGYWALAEGHPELVGSTVHIVDTGIDTGRILGQAPFTVSKADSFATYPYLHLAAGLPLLLAAVESLLAGNEPEALPPLSNEPSRLRSHPTLWGYLATRLKRSVA